MINKLKNISTDIRVNRAYKLVRKELRAINRSRSVEFCVLIHLYYFDTWEMIQESLSYIEHYNFDLYVTITEDNLNYKNKILANFPKAYIFVVPNRGRDVLSFMQVKDILQAKGYKYLLKLHSKKSTHRTDGEIWLKDMLNCLLPKSKNLQAELLNVLKMKDTAVVGPMGQYYNLCVNFDANSKYIMTILDKLYFTGKGEYLQINRNNFGFFAGTMFWVRLESIAKISYDKTPLSWYDVESGQIDGTLPHALERLFCIVPEIENKKIYEIAGSINKINYQEGAIPDWSKVQIK